MFKQVVLIVESMRVLFKIDVLAKSDTLMFLEFVKAAPQGRIITKFN